MCIPQLLSNIFTSAKRSPTYFVFHCSPTRVVLLQYKQSCHYSLILTTVKTWLSLYVCFQLCNQMIKQNAVTRVTHTHTHTNNLKILSMSNVIFIKVNLVLPMKVIKHPCIIPISSTVSTSGKHMSQISTLHRNHMHQISMCCVHLWK